MEWWELAKILTGQRDILYDLEIGLDDVAQVQTEVMSFEFDVSIGNDIADGVDLAGQEYWTCDHALSTVANDRQHRLEILTMMGIPHIVGHPEIDTMFDI